MSECSGLPTTLDLCGISAIHSLWIVSLLGACAELLLMMTRSARWRSNIGLLILTLAPILIAALFPALRSGQFSNWPTWMEGRVFGMTYASWIGCLILVGVFIRSIQLISSLAFVTFLRTLSFDAPPEQWGYQQEPNLMAEVRITSTRWLQQPVTIGWWRPLILIPKHFAVRLNSDQARILITHECVHIQNRDFAWNLLQAFAELFLFYHPATWLLSRRVRTEREFACDDRVISSGTTPADYANVLALLENSRSALQPLVMASNGAPLLQRIQRILGRGQKKYSSLVRLSCFILCAVTGGLAANCGTTNSKVLNSEQCLPEQVGLSPAARPFPVLCCPEG